VDDRRRGVEGAHVALVVQGRSIHEARTDADGAYRFEGAVPDQPRSTWMGLSPTARCDCVVRARTADGRSGQVALVLSARSPDDGDLRLAPLVLGEAFALTIEVSADTGPVAGARVRVGGGPPDHRKSWGWYEAALTDAAGRARLTGLPRGTAGVYVTAEGWGPGVAASPIPRLQGSPLEVRLPPRRHVDILVLEEGTGNPVPEAEVSVVVALPQPDRGWVQLGPAEGIAPTDTRGLTRVPAFAPACRGWAYVRAPGRPQRTRASNAPMAWEASQTVVRVPAPNTLSWVVVPGDGPIPADGTPVRVCRGDRIVYGDGYLPPEVGSIENGHLVIPHAVAQTEHRPYHLIATAPDGRCALAAVAQGQSQGEEVAFRGPRTLTVRVSDHAGNPVAGVGLSLRECRSSCLHERIRPTDRQGVCVLTPLLPEAVRVSLYGIEGWVERQVQDVDLTAGDQTVVLSLPPAQRLLVHVLVDGEPRLPPSWRLQVGRHRVGSRQVTEDARTGTIRTTLACTDPLVGSVVRLETDTFGTATGTAEQAAATDAAVVTLSLRTGGRILARVTPPADGRFSLFLERYVDAIGDFGVTALPVAPEAARDGIFEFAGLEAGRYRLRERFTHLLSGVAVVTEAGGDVELPFDLSGMGMVRGRIEAPEDGGVALARVEVQGLVEPGGPSVPGLLPGGRRAPPNTIPVDAQGEFQLQVPGDRAITLDAWHPFLQSGGPVEVQGPRDDVRLVLRHGPTAALVLDREPTPQEAARLEGSILLFADDVRGEPAWRCPATVSGREILFGRFEPGVYTLWLDGGTLAPIVLRDVHLGPGRTRVEGATVRGGCRLRFELEVPAGRVVSRLLFLAESLDGPPYARSGSVWDAARTAELRALGAGRFRVAVHAIEAPGQEPRLVFEDEISLDGVNDARVTVDLR
jgi:hypothetical protein